MASSFNVNELTPNLGLFLKYIDTVMITVKADIFIEIEELDIRNNNGYIQEEGKSAVLTAYSTIFSFANTENASRNFKRAALLGYLYFLSVLLSNKFINETAKILFIDSLDRYIKEYFEIPSVIEDIKSYLLILSEEESISLMNKVKDLFHEYISSIQELSKSLAYLKLCYKFNKPPPFSVFFTLYKSSLDIEQPPKKGEHRLGDQLIMMASKQYPHNVYFRQFLLENAIPFSQYNYFLKLQLISNYSSTEFSKKSSEIYETLDIKSVQHESLSHLVFGELND